MRIVLVLAPLLLAAFCAPSLAADGRLVGRWRITEIAGVDGLDVSRTRAEFAQNGRFASTIGCNRIAGKPQISGATISFGGLMSTRMACIPPLDAVERAYTESLRAVRGYRRDGETLVFLGEDGNTLVRLEREK
jgi:heat shock protein HslJ